jgi:AcrR family transcriptional regulator
VRAYQSVHRQRQADATRRQILRAARRLFAERGYAATSMADIARRAGVAVQTIYASCGSKRELVLALVDAIDAEADVGSLAERIAETDDPREVLAVSVRLSRRLNERCGDIIEALLSASSVEPEAAAAAAEGKRRHRQGSARSAEKLQAMGALRDGLTSAQAGALISTLTWQSVFAELRAEHGCDLDDCERLITATLVAALLRDASH